MDINKNANLSMLCDYYELTMGNGYFVQGMQDRITYFDIFFRSVPDNGGFAIAAGLEQAIEYVQQLHFDEDDIAYLRSRNMFAEGFLQYLRGFRFTGDIWAVPEGTPVYAAADGKVTVANASDSWGYSWGYYVKINHAEGVDTLYAHLSSVAVSYGQYVHQGDVIGYVGSTGNSSGNHLHFELYLENNRVDPYPYIGTDLLSKYLERTF